MRSPATSFIQLVPMSITSIMIHEDQIVKSNGQNVLTMDTNSEQYMPEAPAQDNLQCKGPAHKWCDGNDHPHNVLPQVHSFPVSMIEVCGLLSHETAANETSETHLSPHAPC